MIPTFSPCEWDVYNPYGNLKWLESVECESFCHQTFERGISSTLDEEFALKGWPRRGTHTRFSPTETPGNIYVRVCNPFDPPPGWLQH
jgi:hypothetical protein